MSYMGNLNWVAADPLNGLRQEDQGNWSYPLSNGYRHTFKLTGCTNPQLVYLTGQKTKCSKNVLIPRPCGECHACQKRKQGTRAMQLHAQLKTTSAAGQPATFVTLTYDNHHLNNALDYEPVQSMLRLMRRNGLQFKHYTKPELGDATARPHWHLILYGTTFDGRPLSGNPDGDRANFNHWPHGHVHQKAMHSDMANYISKYATKAQAITGGYDPKLFKSRQSIHLGRDYLRSWVRQCAVIDKTALPDLIQIEHHNYPISSYIKKQLNEYFVQLGGQPFVPPSMDFLHHQGLLLAQALKDDQIYPMLRKARELDEIDLQSEKLANPKRRALHLGNPKRPKPPKNYRKVPNARY